MRYAAPFLERTPSTRVLLMVSTDTTSGLTGAASATRHRFSLGGVALELLPEPGFSWSLPKDTGSHTQPIHVVSAGPKLAAVTCSLRVDPGLLPIPRELASVSWEQTPDGLCVRARQVVLDLVALGPRHYLAAARIGHPSALTLMLNTLVTSIVELAGGLCLHATAVAHAAGAVLLLGPSGAGKSTAAELLGEGVSCLSNDRVTLVPDPTQSGKYWVWSLPVGKAPALPRSPEVSMPLAALVRVLQASAPSIAPLRGIEAMLQIRQAAEVSRGSEHMEPQRLRMVEALASAAKSGVAKVALTPSWRPQLEALLSGMISPDVSAPVDVSPDDHLQKSSIRVDP